MDSAWDICNTPLYLFTLWKALEIVVYILSPIVGLFLLFYIFLIIHSFIILLPNIGWTPKLGEEIKFVDNGGTWDATIKDIDTKWNRYWVVGAYGKAAWKKKWDLIKVKKETKNAN